MKIERWLVLAGVTALLFGCGKTPSPAAAPDPVPAAKADIRGSEEILKLSAEEVGRAGIRIEILAETRIRDQLAVTATVRANEDRYAHVAPRVPGRLVRVYAKLGDTVKAGQALALLDSVEVGESHAAYLQALSEANVARAAFDRAERLHREEVIPAKEYQRTRADNEKAQAALRAAADRLRLLGTLPGGEIGEPAVSTFPLSAPNAGTVVEKHAVLGELAKPDASLFTIADLSVVWVEADVAEKDLARVTLGADAAISVGAYPGESFKGRVAYIGQLLDKDTRTARSRIEVANPARRLLPGMFAGAVIYGGESAKALAVPESALTLIQGMPVVFVEEAGGFEARPVEIGERTGGRAIVTSGLKAGERVVVAGAYALKARKLKSQIGDSH